MKISIFEIFVGFAGIIAAIATILALFKREKKDESATKIYEILKENIANHSEKNTKVPHGREFSSKVLQCPSLEDIGVKTPLSDIPFITPHVDTGDWVKRGEKLVTYSYVRYGRNKIVSFLRRLIFKKNTIVDSFTFRSPVSGLVINRRWTNCRFDSNSHNMSNMYHGTFDRMLKLPNLLIPKNEPKWGNHGLKNTTREICNYINHHWKNNLFNMGSHHQVPYKKMRLFDAIKKYNVFCHDEESKRQLDSSLKQVENGFSDILKKEICWPVVEFKELSEKNAFLDQYIDEMRIKDDQLFLLLDHLVINKELSN